MKIALPTEQNTLALGAALAGHARHGDVFALVGPLGAGKTTLARGFIQKRAGVDEEVVSPTFTLVQTYDTTALSIWHFDLYRLKTADEVLELGLEEALATGVSLIEWPERLGHLLPKNRRDVTLSLAGGAREAVLAAHGTWGPRLIELERDVRNP